MEKDFDNILILIDSISREVNYLINSFFEEQNLNRTEIFLLMKISKNSGINQYQLAKKYFMDRPLVVRNIKKMVEKKLVFKEQAGNTKILKLTENGKKMYLLIEKKRSNFAQLLIEKKVVSNPAEFTQNLESFNTFIQEASKSLYLKYMF